ncbi:GntR family transcriptional regulator [Roseomonas gilardii]|uniref:GntR family transcriptional regulator n=1 Tax=Roseomonas gilardii TaxID=257708 RepID=UPI001643B5A8|nr:GntR family transcriptional regulator [Roseomonas gilardii]
MRAVSNGRPSRGETPSGAAQPLPRSLSAEAYHLLEHDIVIGLLQPGSFLSEPDLIRATGLGRTPVREALRRLESNHLVTIVPHRGAFVREVPARAHLQMLAVREELEPVLATLAAQRADAAALRALRLQTTRLRAACAGSDKPRLFRIDRVVKGLLLHACRNVFISRALEPAFAGGRQLFWSTVAHADPDFCASYLALSQAVAQRDGSAAADAARHHVAQVARLTRLALDHGR